MKRPISARTAAVPAGAPPQPAGALATSADGSAPVAEEVKYEKDTVIERDGKAEAWTTCAYFVVLGALMRNWWIEMLQAACAGTVLIAIAHTTAVTAICWVHATGNGQRLASTSIAVRAFASLGVCLVLLCVYVAGWEASC